MNDAIKMQISAFVDGELPSNEAELLLRRLCQDRQLRQQAAEYLAMGRVIRGEHVFAGMATLRERIEAEIDDKALDDEVVDASPAPSRYVRPLAGAAIAATVAMAALLGLQRTDDVPTVSPSDSEGAIVDAGYTVPDSDDVLRGYYELHNASTYGIGSELLAPSLATWEIQEGVVVESEAQDEPEPAEADENPTP